MWPFRQLSRNDAAFFYATLLLLFLTLLTARLFVADYLAFDASTRRHINDLLVYENFPSRRERHQALLAAVLGITLPRDHPTTADPHLTPLAAFSPTDSLLIRLEDDLHASALDLWKDAALRQGTLGSRATFARFGGTSMFSLAEWNTLVAKRITSYKSTDTHAKVLPSSEANPVLEKQFGAAGIDPPDLEVATSLYIPPLVPSQRSPSGTLEYAARVHAANDFSLVIDALLSLAGPRLSARSQEPERVVQAYFFSPDGLLRYWSANPSETAIKKFSMYATWTSSPFIMETLDWMARQRAQSPAAIADHDLDAFLRTRLGRPYIDVGEYGIVRTRTTAFRTTTGVLLGVFCTDVAVALPRLETAATRPRGHQPRHSPLFDWELVALPNATTEKPTTLLRSNSGGTRLIDLLPSRTSTTSGSSTALGASFEHIEPIQLGRERLLFLVPMGWSDGRRVALLLLPKTPSPPRATAIAFLLVSSAFGILIAVRTGRSRRVQIYESKVSILRDLQAGVLSVDDEGIVLEGNDRAEEILGRRLVCFGVDHDAADVFTMEQIIDEPLLHKLTRPSGSALDAPDTYSPLTLVELRNLRRRGLSFPYYARLLRSVPRDGAAHGVHHQWIRVKGTPVLGGEIDKLEQTEERLGLRTPSSLRQRRKRSIAVVHTVQLRRAAELEEAWNRFREDKWRA